MAEKFDVVVIGAGVIGCSVAYYLAREGIKVALLERESFGSGSSAHATGFISLLGTEFTPGPSFQFRPAWTFSTNAARRSGWLWKRVKSS